MPVIARKIIFQASIVLLLVDAILCIVALTK